MDKEDSSSLPNPTKPKPAVTGLLILVREPYGRLDVYYHIDNKQLKCAVPSGMGWSDQIDPKSIRVVKGRGVTRGPRSSGAPEAHGWWEFGPGWALRLKNYLLDSRNGWTYDSQYFINKSPFLWHFYTVVL